MKYLLIAFAFILSANIYAQTNFEAENIFVRVYDQSGTKIEKGNIVSYTDTSLKLIKRGDVTDIPANTIGSIETKHSAGNNVLIGTLAGIGAGVVTGDIGLVAGGAAAGALVGGLSTLFKKPQTFAIDGDGTNLKDLEQLLED